MLLVTVSALYSRSPVLTCVAYLKLCAPDHHLSDSCSVLSVSVSLTVRDYTYKGDHTVFCFSVSALFHLAQCPPGPSV